MDEEEKKIWEMEAEPVLDSDDKRGQFRTDLDKIMGRGMIRYNVSEEGQLETQFPDVYHRVTERDDKLLVDKGNIIVTVSGGYIKVDVSSSYVTVNIAQEATITCPLSTINGNVIINGNLTVNGNIHASGNISAGGDVTAGSVSLRNHTHSGCQGGSTGKAR